MRLRLAAMQLGAQVVCVKCFVRCPAMVCLQTMRGGHEGVEGQPLDKLRHTGNFAALTREKRKAHQVAKRVRQGQRPSSSARLLSARSPDFESPFCAARLLVSADDRAINEHVFKVGFSRDHVENALKYIGFSPTAKPPEHRIPYAETWRQVAP